MSTIGAVLAVPVGGGPLVPLATSQGVPLGIAVDSSNVYWADGFAVMRVALAGGAISTLNRIS